jgi:hypothetical protein
MKYKLTTLELLNKELVSKLEFGKALEQVKVLFGNEEYLGTETEFYHISNECLIYSLKKKDVANRKDLKQHFEDLEERVFQDQKQLFALIHRHSKNYKNNYLIFKVGK